MRKFKGLKKATAITCALSMVVAGLPMSSPVFAATDEQKAMVADATKNLALSKTTSLFPECAEGAQANLNDGKLKADVTGDAHCALSKKGWGYTGESYAVIDLGDYYDASTIEQVLVQYKDAAANDTCITRGYEIQFSSDNATWNTVASAGEDVTFDEDNCTVNDISTTGAVRYVRAYYPKTADYGIQITEIAVLDTNGDAKTVEVSHCENAAGVTVKSEDYNQITYNITAGENQADYKYMVYDDNVLVGNQVEAGKDYKIDGVSAGIHKLKVVSSYNGTTSEGIDSEEVTVKDSSELYTSPRNIVNKNNNADVSITDISSYYSDEYAESAVNMIDGLLTAGEEKDVAFRTGKTSPQSFVIDLGREYKTAELDRFMIAYTNPRTYAKKYSIELSDDGAEYKEVASGDSLICGTDGVQPAYSNAVKLDKLSNYEAENVRYVKVTLSEGAVNYGYVINEIAIVANTDTPTYTTTVDIDAPADLKAESTKYGVIDYEIVAGEGQEDYEYNVYVDGKLAAEKVKAGKGQLTGVTDGTHNISVKTVKDGSLSKAVTKTVVVPLDIVEDGTNLVNENTKWTLNNESDNWSDNPCGTGTSLATGSVVAGGNWYSLMAHTTLVFEQGKVYTVKFTIKSNVKKQFLVATNTNGDKFLASSATATWTGNDEEGYTCDYSAEFEWTAATSKQNFIIALGQLTTEKDGDRGIKENDSIAAGDSINVSVTDISVVGKTKQVESSDTTTSTTTPSATTNPSVTTPDASSADVTQPDVSSADVTSPDASSADVSTPDVSTPDVSTPDASTPDASTPDVSTPDASTPDASTPDTSTSDETTTPKVTTVKPTTAKPTTAKPTVKPTVKPTTKKASLKSTKVTKKVSKKLSSKKVKLTFKKVKGAKKYDIQVSTSKKFKKVLYKKTVKKTKVTLSSKKLKGKKKLYVRVKAVGAKKWSKPVKIKIKK